MAPEHTAPRHTVLSELDMSVASARTILRGKAGYRQFGFISLLTPEGYAPKTDKGRKRGYSTAIMYLAPANLSGYDVCQYRSAGCTAACLNTAGHGGVGLDAFGLNPVQRARIARTRFYFLNRFLFNVQLVREITAHIARAAKRGTIPCVRLNGTSDLPWETLRLNDGRTVVETFPTVQFYDYTKHAKRALANAAGEHPSNYALTFSRSETNASDCVDVLAAGGNVAAVLKFCKCKRTCKHETPTGLEYFGRPVVSGDHDDLRFLDPRGVVIGLKAKGLARSDTSGFVVDTQAAA
jgi:hypothetical protein